MSDHFLCSLCKQVTDVLGVIPSIVQRTLIPEETLSIQSGKMIAATGSKLFSNSLDITIMVSPVHATNFDRVSLIYDNDKMTGKLLILKSRIVDR